MPAPTRLHRSPASAPAAALAALLVAACAGQPDAEPLTYVGREECASCHESEVLAYTGSDHDRAMEHATTETVLGDFSGTPLVHQGVETRMEVREGRFFVTTDGPSGALEEYEVLYTFGVRPLQQYLVALEDGKIQRLPWSWDSRRSEEGGQRWFHVYGDDAVAAGDILHWTRSSQRWNRMCADCHSTDLEKAYDAATDRYATTWSEIDVSCEACHGPASGHLGWATDPDRGAAPERAGFPVSFTAPDDVAWVRNGSTPTARRATPGGDDRGIEACARCHAHRTAIAPHEAGGRFDDTYRLSLIQAPLYHADGQVREEVFVYGSFLQSKMYAAGVGCTDCHDPHTAELRTRGNGLCTRCHGAETFDGPGHHRHPEGEAAPACVDCHMPETTFMQVDARRDHGFRVPRPTAEGAPDACLSCHEDRDGAWVEVTLHAWYGPPTDSAALLRARAFEDAERGEPAAAPALARVSLDPSTPALLRATAVAYLVRYPARSTVTTLARTLRDPHPRVRAEAVEALRTVEPARRLALVKPLLGDSTLLVRIAAARALAAAPRGAFSPEEAAALDRALAEYTRSTGLNADDPTTWVQLGDDRGEQGRPVDAEEAYRRALELESGFVPAWLNLADLLRQIGRDGDARTTLEAGRVRNPEAPVLAYALGLFHVRAGDPESAAPLLAEAVALDPGDPRFPVAHALTLERLGRLRQATIVLERALPQVSDPAPLRALLARLRGGDDDPAPHREDPPVPERILP